MAGSSRGNTERTLRSKPLDQTVHDSELDHSNNRSKTFDHFDREITKCGNAR